VRRGSFSRNGHARTESQPVGEITQCVESGVDDLVGPRFHNDGKRAGSSHFVGAILGLGSGDVAILRIPGVRGTYSDTRLSDQAAA
jgi:hypothetical protein